MRHKDALQRAFEEGHRYGAAGMRLEPAWQQSNAKDLAALDLGETGHHPQGKVDPTDEGELRMAITADYQQAIVRIEFGKPTAWFGLPAGKTRELARMLTEHATLLERRRT